MNLTLEKIEHLERVREFKRDCVIRRRMLRLSHQELADAAGLSLRVIEDYEFKSYLPKEKTIQSIGVALGFFAYDENKKLVAVPSVFKAVAESQY